MAGADLRVAGEDRSDDRREVRKGPPRRSESAGEQGVTGEQRVRLRRGEADRSSIPVTWALGANDADDVIAEATAKLEACEHHSFKLKMGSQDPAGDIGRIDKIAAHSPPERAYGLT